MNISTLQKKKFYIVSGIVLLILIFAIFFIIRRIKAFSNQAVSIPIQTAQVEKGNISNSIDSSGTLAAAEAVDVMVPSSLVVDKIYVSEGDSIKKGDKLVTFTESSIAESLLDLNEKIEKVEEKIDDLSDDAEDSSSDEYLEKVVLEAALSELKTTRTTIRNIQKKGALTASAAGMLSASYVDAQNENVSETTQKTSASNTSASASSVITATNVSSTSTTKIARVTRLSMTNNGTNNGLKAVRLSTNTDSRSMSEDNVSIISGGKTSSVSIKKPVTGNSPQTSVSSTTYFSGSISWNCEGKFQAGQSYMATILLTANPGFAFSASENYSIAASGGSMSSDSPVLIGNDGTEGNQLRFTVTYETEKETTELPEETTTEEKIQTTTEKNNQTVSSTTQAKKETTASTAEKKEQSSTNATTSQQKQSQGTTVTEQQNASTEKQQSMVSGNQITDKSQGSNTTSAPSGMNKSSSASVTSNATGNVTATANQSASATTNSEYAVEKQTLFSIASSKKIAVDVEVDELDINSVEKGQTATVSLDAVEDSEYSGTVTDIANIASDSGGGNAKYTVEVTIEKTSDMKVGMTAGVTIKVDQSDQTLLIPINALQEKDGKSFVYTSKEDNNLSGEIEVETGLSDGTQVEIKSGLLEGDTVYYMKSTSDSDKQKGMDQNIQDMMRQGKGQGMPNGNFNYPGQGGAPNGKN